jgi:GH24 family phage-related lysozyme (muramidase)
VDSITLAQAEELLDCDLTAARAVVLRHVNVPLSDHELAAATCLAFAIGETLFASSGFVKSLNAGRKKKAANEMLRFVMVTDPDTKLKRPEPGLVLRRMEERAAFLTPDDR